MELLLIMEGTAKPKEATVADPTKKMNKTATIIAGWN